MYYIYSYKYNTNSTEDLTDMNGILFRLGVHHTKHCTAKTHFIVGTWSRETII